MESTSKDSSSKATKPKASIRIVIVGDGDTGKTCLMYAYVKNDFLPDYNPTTFDQNHVEVTINNDKYTVILTDIAGQQEYYKLREPSYSNVDIFILTYSSISRDSYQNVKNFWVPEIENYQIEKRREKEKEENGPSSSQSNLRASFKKILKSSNSKKSDSRRNLSKEDTIEKSNNTPTTMSVPTILCSTKIDIREMAAEKDRISFQEGEKLKDAIKAKCFVECSALTQENVKAVFDMALMAYLQSNGENGREGILDENNNNIPGASGKVGGKKNGASSCITCNLM